MTVTTTIERDATEVLARLDRAPLTLRAVITYGDRAAHVDLGIEAPADAGGPAGFGITRFSAGLDGEPRRWRPEVEVHAFAPTAIWPALRRCLPPDSVLRHDPVADVDFAARPPDPALHADLLARAHTCAVLGLLRRDAEGRVVAARERTWIAVGGEVLAVDDAGVRTAPPGALAATLVWDLTGLLEDRAVAS